MELRPLTRLRAVELRTRTTFTTRSWAPGWTTRTVVATRRVLARTRRGIRFFSFLMVSGKESARLEWSQAFFFPKGRHAIGTSLAGAAFTRPRP
jgi:hypothetical protein